MSKPVVKWARLQHYKGQNGLRFAKLDDAGIDIYYSGSEAVTMTPGVVYQLETGVKFEIPRGYCGLVMERSGLGIKQGIEVVARVIDSGYRGELFIGLCANSEMRKGCGEKYATAIEPIVIRPGDRIAQLVFVEHLDEMVEVKECDLCETERGAAGIGSTGV